MYPSRLLPKVYYHKLDIDELIDKDYYLIRHYDKKDIIEGTKMLLPSSIRIVSDQLRDFSTNLLGIFKKEDVKYAIRKGVNKDYDELWNEGEKVTTPKDEECEIIEDRNVLYINIKELTSNPINKPNNNGYSEELYYFKLYATPTKRNFWHISIRLFSCEYNEEVGISDNITKSKKKKIWKFFKDYLVSDIFKMECDTCYTIDKTLYK